MPKSPSRLDREIADALARHKRMSKFLKGKPLREEPAGRRAHAKSTPLFGAAPTAARKPRRSSASSASSASSKAARGKTSASKTPKNGATRKSQSKRTTALAARRISHSVKGATRDEIEELIASDDPNDWSVARDFAIEQRDQELIVQLDMARALNVPPSDLDVTEGRPYDESFEVEVGKNSYVVVPDEDTAHAIALARVTEDLESEPENFTPSFVESHIDEKKLKRYVYDSRMEDEYVDELAERQVDDFWDLAQRLDVDGVVPDTDEDGEQMEPTSKQIEAVKEAYAKEASENPMEFFRDIYGNEAVKYAIEAAGIDVAGAAEEALSADGWEHFLAHYDGNSHTTDTGLVYWRT